ncbi:MAG: DUF4981 domain-containing protein [Treponema sp.]|nr:DUF4981 domain-containing protein [Treponema sp.]
MNKRSGFHTRADWENFDVSSINREPAHTRWGAFENEKQAAACRYGSSKFTKNLNGVWQFRLYKNPDAVDDFYKPDYDDKNFGKINVPGNWELQPQNTPVFERSGKPIYTNVVYPWDLEEDEKYAVTAKNGKRVPQPPFVPKDNPTGCYRTRFDMSTDFDNRETFLRFEGVETAYYVWVNGKPVGYSQDSKLPSEFNITEFLVKGSNLIALEVIRFADSTYLEDQDYWYLSGIYRSVWLVSKPVYRIVDYKITALPILPPMPIMQSVSVLSPGQFVNPAIPQTIPAETDAVFSIDVSVSRAPGFAGCRIKVSLYDTDKKIGEAAAEVEAEAGYRTDAKPTANSARAAFSLKNIKQWSPANPKLYTVVITLIGADGKAVDFESCRTGFKVLEIRKGVLYLNGARLVVNGVNRHDHCYKYGRAVPAAHMREEIIQMKRMNINAVRTCHYPDAPDWYDLCDELGILLVCETNLETHGVSGMLSHRPELAKEYVERGQRMVVNYKNHVSIYSWSLGNESGTGANHAAMYGFIKEYDSTRVCQYEAGAPGKNISDIRGNMYAPVDHILEMLADPNDDRPIILVEYLYQIMNSGGGLQKFLWLTSQFPRFQGGFVWDWQDKSLPAKTKDGREFFAVGGDFNEPFVEKGHPVFMCCNGVVLPDLKWKPVAYELKQAYCAIRIERSNLQAGRSGSTGEDKFIASRPVNLCGDTKAEALDCFAVIREDGIIIAEKPVRLPDLPIGGRQSFEYKLPIKKQPGKEYTITFSLKQKEDTFYAAKGTEAGAYQFLLEQVSDLQSASALVKQSNSLKQGKSKQQDKSVTEKQTVFVFDKDDSFQISIPGKVHGRVTSAIIDKKTGLLTEFRKAEDHFIKTGFMPTLKRPLTGLDCRKDWGWYNEYDRTRNLVHTITGARLFTETEAEGADAAAGGNRIAADGRSHLGTLAAAVRIEFSFVMGDKKSPPINGTLAYTFNADGRMNVDYRMRLDQTLQAVPRIGLEMVLAEGFKDVKYYGYGPTENYPDRMLAAVLAVHDSSIEAQHFPFIPPCENGGHEGTRWLQFGADGRGIKIESKSPFHFDVHFNTADDYISAAHDHELIRRKTAVVHIDAAHGPIGSDMAWSTVMPAEHALGGGTYSLNFDFLIW